MTEARTYRMGVSVIELLNRPSYGSFEGFFILAARIAKANVCGNWCKGYRIMPSMIYPLFIRLWLRVDNACRLDMTTRPLSTFCLPCVFQAKVSYNASETLVFSVSVYLSWLLRMFFATFRSPSLRDLSEKCFSYRRDQNYLRRSSVWP